MTEHLGPQTTGQWEGEQASAYCYHLGSRSWVISVGNPYLWDALSRPASEAESQSGKYLL